MPWINQSECTGCGICVKVCPVDSIALENAVADIDMDTCIHCGLCHDVCPVNAVRHDSERIPREVSANVARTREFMDDCRRLLGAGEDRKCLERMIRHFRKEKKVIEATLGELEALTDKGEMA
ncbi:MAG: 4Fe-4S binding protein [Candidatus Aminicenantes bacterium]|nr:4Fe-4S binding protein [Candidatus Aminicenantes bacterium]